MANNENLNQVIENLENLNNLLETRDKSRFWLSGEDRIFENLTSKQNTSAFCEFTWMQMQITKKYNVEALPVKCMVNASGNLLHLKYYEDILPKNKARAEAAYEKVLKTYGKCRMQNRILLVCCVVWVISMFGGFALLLPSIAAFIGAMVVIYLKNASGTEYFNAKTEYAQSIIDMKKSIENYYKCEALNKSAFDDIDGGFENALDLMRTYWDVRAEMYDFYQKAYAEMKADYVSSCEAIAADETLSPEYYHLLPSLISSLKSGRADDFKEALNLAINEEREEKREQQRQLEEERRTAAIDRQTAEQTRHNRELERQNAAHNSEMEEIGRKNAAAAMAAATATANAISQERRDRKREEQRQYQADKNARNAGMHQCSACANYRSCPSSARSQNRGTCGAFRPKR